MMIFLASMLVLLLAGFSGAGEQQEGITSGTSSAPTYNAPLKPAASGPFVPPQDSPAVQVGLSPGTILSVDTVYQKLTVREDRGTVREFQIDSTTPILDHFAQIGFQDLQPGQRVLIHYNVDPLLVNQVDRL